MVGPITEESNEFAAEWREARANRDPRFFFGVGFGADTNGLHAQPRRGRVPPRTPSSIRSAPSTATWSCASSARARAPTTSTTDGVDHYGLHPDWVEDLRKVAGNQIVTDLANGAEAYLQMWQRAVSHQAPLGAAPDR